MITVISRPQSHKLADAGPTGALTSSGGEAFITTDFAHGLVDDDWIYMQSNFESYTGFFQVTDTTYNSFKLLRRGAVVAFKQNAAVSYQVSVYDHGFVPVHNPIVYELGSDLSPHNTGEEAYTPVTINSQEDEEGYTRLHLSVGIDPEELEFVKFIGGSITGAYQITEVLNPWDIVINLAYDASNTFGQVVKYYNNYVININVWAGYPNDHPWGSVKPYEVAALLQLTPDESNRVKFSISDILRGYLTLRNNLLLDTLPNNTDFSTAYFIEYWESYDVSDGQEITTFEGDATVDTFEGYALQAAMPFKTLGMSDYVNKDSYLAKWLVLQQYPIASIGNFFDMSFLLTQIAEATPGFTPSPVPLLEDWGTLNESAETTGWVLAIPNPYCIIDAGVSVGGFFDYFFTGVVAMTFEVGRTYKYSFTMGLDADISGADTMLFRIHFQVRNNAYTILDSATFDQTVFGTFSGVGSVGGEFEFVALAGATNIGFRIEMPNGTTDSAVVTMGDVTDLTESEASSEGGTLLVYDNGDLISEIFNPGIGIIRVPFEFTTVGRHCVKVSKPANAGTPSEETSVDDFPDLALFVQTGSGASWILGAAPTVTNPGAGFPGVSSKILYVDYAFINGYTYKITTNYTKDYNSGSDNPRAISISSRNSSNTVIETMNHATFASPGGTESFDFTFVATSTTTRLALFTTDGSNIDLTINSIAATQTNPEIPASPQEDITEEICVDVIDECSGTFIDQLRLLESEFFRLLE